MWGGYGQPGMMGHDGGWYWWMGLHGLIWLLFIALLVVGLVALIRFLWRGGPAHPTARGTGRSAALDLLEARYARGEIEREEYLQKKQDLA